MRAILFSKKYFQAFNCVCVCVFLFAFVIIFWNLCLDALQSRLAYRETLQLGWIHILCIDDLEPLLSVNISCFPWT